MLIIKDLDSIQIHDLAIVGVEIAVESIQQKLAEVVDVSSASDARRNTNWKRKCKDNPDIDRNIGWSKGDFALVSLE